MASIEENAANMTVFYFKSSGDIKSIVSGVQSMDTFGIHKLDYEQIIDFIVIPLDLYVTTNISFFKVNIQNKQLEMLQTAIPQYPIAAQ